MADTWSGKRPRELNDDTIAAVRRRIGIPVRYSPRAHNEVSSTDSFRHFALAYGDDNPLYTDPSHADASSWGSPIAPPLYAFNSGRWRPVNWSPAEQQEMKGDPLAGIGQYMCGERWLFVKPIRAGDLLWRTQHLFSADLKTSDFAGGTGALVSHRVSWEDESGSPFAFRFLDFWHADREASRKAAKNLDMDRPSYTDQDIERFDACYGSEAVRGATPRLATDVAVGDELGEIVKGPLTTTEMVAWHVGIGWGEYGGGASKVAYKNRKRVPKFYLKNQFGTWETAQRCHWDDEWAQRMGHPGAYDYGVMRTNWMVNLVTNWMGDDAWIWKLSASVRKFNYMGDVHFVSGVVRDVDRATNAVTIDVTGVNQRGTTTCDARVVVIFPPASGGHAEIPAYRAWAGPGSVGAVNDVPVSTPAETRADFLAGLRVLELGDGVAGAAATSVLWSLGADVVAFTDPASAHRRGRPFVDQGGTRTSLLSVILDRGKRIVGGEGTELGQLIGAGFDGAPFDLVVVDRVLGGGSALTTMRGVDRYAEFADGHNPRAWLTISAFGLTGTRAEDVATELTVAAASGMLAAARDEKTGRPLKLAGQQSLLNTGQAGALASCHAIDLSRTGDRVHLDLAAVEVALATGPVLEVGGLLLNTGAIGGAKRYGAPASFYHCTDGLVRISAMEDHQWRGVVAAMGSPDWAERFATVEARIEAADQVDEHVEAWARTRTKQQAETLLQSHGVPATAVYSPAEILDSAQLMHRGAFQQLQVGDGRETRIVGLPFRVVDGGNTPESAARRARRSLNGLRMLEASRVLAVPLAGSILGALGVEVTKLEDLPRLDMYRRRGPYINGEPGMEQSAYFALMNHSKHSAAFDVDARRDLLDDLLSSTDVVVENLGPKRAMSLGLAASSAVADHPDVLAVSSSGFGQDGPHADYRAYAYNLQASCALGYLTRNDDGNSAEIDIAWADLIAAYTLATIVAAWAVGPSGNAGAGLDFAMADLVVAHFNEFLAAAGLDADMPVDRANELSPYAPNGVYPTLDGWLAVSVDGDEQFAHLERVLADDALVTGHGFDTAGARFDSRRDLDARIANATRSRPGAELAVALRAGGVTAEMVATPETLLDDAQLASRGFLTPVVHEEWGRRRLVGIPWRIFGGPPLPLGAPPRLEPKED